MPYHHIPSKQALVKLEFSLCIAPGCSVKERQVFTGWIPSRQQCQSIDRNSATQSTDSNQEVGWGLTELLTQNRSHRAYSNQENQQLVQSFPDPPPHDGRDTSPCLQARRHQYLSLMTFSRTTWVSRHQKGQTNPDFNEARDDGMVVTSAGSYANHLQLGPDR